MKLFAIALSCALAASAADEAVLIRDADVYPVTSAPVKNVSVLIRDGKIAEIGPKIAAGKGVHVVEAKGLRVYPGIIDSGTELGLSEIPSERMTVDTGELGEFMPQLRALVAVNPESEHFGVVRVNGITSAMVFPGSTGGGGGRFGGGATQMIAGQAAMIHTDGWTWEDMAVSRSAAVQMIFPTLGRGGRGGYIPDNVTLEMFGAGGVTTFAHQKRTDDQQIEKLAAFFEDARRYQKARAANAPGFERNLKYEAMIPVLERKEPVAVSVSRAQCIHDAIAFAEKENIRIVLLQPEELLKVAPEVKAKNVPVILGRVLALPEHEDDPYDEAFTLPGEAYKAGIKFAFGTFTNEFVRNIPYQAATAVAFGLPYDEALKSITINPAEIWGVADQVGSIEKGKSADLMITNGDPLEIQTQVSHVFIKGKDVPLTNKQTRLYEKYLNRP